MNDRELETRMRDAFDALEPPASARQSVLDAYDRLAAETGSVGADTAQVIPIASAAKAKRRRPSRKVRFNRFIAGLAACLVLGVACFGFFRIANVPGDPTTSGDTVAPASFDTVISAYVDIDINPSIELQLNNADQVVSVEGINDDGQAVVADLSLTGLSYGEALEKLTQSPSLAPYLRDDAYVQVSVASDNAEQEQMLVDISEERLAALPCRGSCDAVSLQVREEAHAHGMGCGRYIAAVELSTLDPNVTVDDCHGMSMREIRNRIDACHDRASSSSYGGGASQGGSASGYGDGYGQHHGESHGRHHS